MPAKNGYQRMGQKYVWAVSAHISEKMKHVRQQKGVLVTRRHNESMEKKMFMRFTEEDEQGNWRVKGIPWEQIHTGSTLTNKTAEILYGALWKLMEYEDTGLTPEEVQELKDFVDSLPLLATAVPAAVMEPEWIPVEERLPESMQPILMSCESRITKPVVIAGYCDIQEVMDEYGENVVEHYHEWFKARSPYDIKLYDVVAWMPFPEPYRPQSMEKAGGGAGEGAAQGGLLPAT